MAEPIIRVENLSKLYRLGKQEERAGTLMQALGRLASAPVRNFQKLRSLTHFEDAGKAEDILWAVKDVSFDVGQGEIVGIIGRNGAGKSTLLKILSRITPPTRGTVTIRGRMASLLEVGTGFHPELSGRDNIFLNGAILGMTRREIARKFDEIVAFSEIEKFIDTPVKRYSSGMYVRLAFAVAAHLEPDILILDEVLAVGDASFQKKCLGKIKDVSGAGRTVLFVSHSMSAVSALCRKAVLMQGGRATGPMPVSQAVGSYLAEGAVASTALTWEGEAGDESLVLTKFSVTPEDGSAVIRTDQEIAVEFCFTVKKAVEDVVIALHLETAQNNLLAFTAQYDDPSRQLPTSFSAGRHRFMLTIPGNTLAQGDYKATPNIGIFNRKRIVGETVTVNFSTVNTQGLGLRFLTGGAVEGIFRPAWKWEQQ
jgi:lipopolysaccharide transport system ATP-binding protein